MAFEFNIALAAPMRQASTEQSRRPFAQSERWNP
jgi:hypothetical protein